MIEEPSLDEWWMDLTPPIGLPDEPKRSPVIHVDFATSVFTSGRRTGGRISFRAPEFEETRDRLQRFIDKYVNVPPKFITLIKKPIRPYPNDKPTNLEYPTSWDSWGCEFITDHPPVQARFTPTRQHHRHRR